MSRHRRLVSGLVLVMLIAAACGDGPGTESWSAGTRDAYTAACVSVANAVGGISDPDAHCTCTVRKLQAEFTETEYLARTQDEQDAVSALYGAICEIRDKPPAVGVSWSGGLRDEYTGVCLPVARAVGDPDPERLCACTLDGLQEVYSEAGYRAITPDERDRVSDLLAQICLLRFARE